MTGAPSDAETPLLEARGLTRCDRRSGAPLLDSIDFVLFLGEAVALTGASGSGKSLLLRALCLLDPLQGGELLWRGRPVDNEDVPIFRSRVHYVQQQPSLAEGRVEESLRQPFGLAVHRHRRYSRTQAIELLADLGRDAAFLDKDAGDVSGGEAQVVAFVRALLLAPMVLLLDEPAAALDAGTTRALERVALGWLHALPGERALVWVSHDLQQAQRVARRHLRFDGTRLVDEAGHG